MEWIIEAQSDNASTLCDLCGIVFCACDCKSSYCTHCGAAVFGGCPCRGGAGYPRLEPMSL